MFAYSKKEYEIIDPVELPAEITDAQVTSGVGTDEGNISVAWATIIAFALVGVTNTVVVPTPLVTWVSVISGGNVAPPPPAGA
jgi:hypothetical protein